MSLKITPIPSGPLKVAGVTSASFCGKPLEASGDVYLCRCGESKNAPFCDGSHKPAGFTGDNTGESEAKPLRVWEGRTIQTTFNPNVCMHVFYCKPLQELRARELAGDDDAAQEIAEVVASCPSGALTYSSNSVEVGGAEQSELVIMEGGEIRVTCDFETEGFELQAEQPSDRATLCRCGRSDNKPWCDGRHKGRKDFR